MPPPKRILRWLGALPWTREHRLDRHRERRPHRWSSPGAREHVRSGQPKAQSLEAAGLLAYRIYRITDAGPGLESPNLVRACANKDVARLLVKRARDA